MFGIEFSIVELLAPAAFAALGYALNSIIAFYSDRRKKRKEDIINQVQECILEIFLSSQRGGESTSAFATLKRASLLAVRHLNKDHLAEFFSIARQTSKSAERENDLVDGGLYLVPPCALLSLILRNKVDEFLIVELVTNLANRYEDGLPEEAKRVLAQASPK